MAEKIDQKILNTINRYLDILRINNLTYESVWLFGSFAENLGGEDSDIDIAMIMPEVNNKFDKELELTRYRRQVDSRIEPHVLNNDDLDTPFSKEIFEKGIKIV